MTKQEAMEKVWPLLELLEALPDGADIMTAGVRDFSSLEAAQIFLRTGIETVSKALGLPIQESTPDEYIHREIHAGNCEYVQLDDAPEKKAAPGNSSTEDGRAAQAAI